MPGGLARNDVQDLTGSSLLLSCLRELAHGLGEFFAQLSDSAFSTTELSSLDIANARWPPQLESERPGAEGTQL
jgi:hypothetical protein